MSHYVAWVLVSAAKARGGHVEVEVERLLAPYDENLEVPEREERCGCVGGLAKIAVAGEVNARYPVDDPLRARLREQVGDRVMTLTDIFAETEPVPPASPAEYRRAQRTLDLAWDKLLWPRNAFEEAQLAAHPKRDAVDPECEDCRGTGKVRTTRNLQGRWDWYSIGGRWTGRLLTELLPRAAEDARARQQRRLLAPDVVPLHALDLDDPDCPIPLALVDVDGSWHAYAKMGWFGTTCGHDPEWDDKVKAILRRRVAEGCWLVAVDLHT